MEMDWVKRKAIGEQFVEQQQEDIWKDLCTSLEAATNSFRIHYGGAAHGRVESEHQFRIAVGAKPPYQDALIDVMFKPPEIRVVCTMGQCKMSTFYLNANREAPFRNSNKEPLTSDEVSEAILRGIFFPAEARGVQSRIVTPCAS